MYKIMNAPVRTFPFPHLLIEEFLDWGLYDALLDAWPDGMFQDISKIRPVEGYKDRRAWHFNKQPPQAGPWSVLHEVMHATSIRRAMIHKLMKGLSHEMLSRVVETSVTDSLLVQDRPGYSIGPHTDAPQKIVSGLLYLPEPGVLSDPRLGTSLYIAVGEKQSCPGGPHHDRDDPEFLFEEVFRAPYLPNVFVTFLKTERSFHGVEPVPPGMKRRVYIWNVRETPV